MVSPDQSKGQIHHSHRSHLHIPDGLSKVAVPALKKEIVLSVEAEVTGHPRDAAEGKWTLGGGVEVPCIDRFYGPKKSKAAFRNKLSK